MSNDNQWSLIIDETKFSLFQNDRIINLESTPLRVKTEFCNKTKDKAHNNKRANELIWRFCCAMTSQQELLILICPTKASHLLPSAISSWPHYVQCFICETYVNRNYSNYLYNTRSISTKTLNKRFEQKFLLQKYRLK